MPSGTAVPQIVLIEDQRLERASKGSSGYIIPSDFSAAGPGRRGGGPTQRTNGTAGKDVIEVIQGICAAEFGPFPQPATVQKEPDGEWLIRFRNHGNDRNPSTIVRGEFQQLLLGGSHEFGDRQIFLPDDLTANELIEHALVQCGRGEQHSYDEHTKSVRGARLRAGHPWIRQREVWFGRHRLDGLVDSDDFSIPTS